MSARYDLSPKDAAAYLGVHEDTLKRWVKDGRIPVFVTPGKWRRFSRADLDAFRESQVTPAGDAA